MGEMRAKRKKREVRDKEESKNTKNTTTAKLGLQAKEQRSKDKAVISKEDQAKGKKTTKASNISGIDLSKRVKKLVKF